MKAIELQHEGVTLMQRIAKTSVLSIMMLAASLSFVGCGGNRNGGTAVLPSRPRPYVVDVPVPEGFELDRRKSTHENRPGERIVKHYYVGDEKPQAANDFYKQLMPTFDWEFLDERLQNGAFILNYKKAGENCEIRVDQMPGGFWGPKTRVAAEIRPRD